jgi:hypothetical protein
VHPASFALLSEQEMSHRQQTHRTQGEM